MERFPDGLVTDVTLLGRRFLPGCQKAGFAFRDWTPGFGGFAHVSPRLIGKSGAWHRYQTSPRTDGSSDVKPGISGPGFAGSLHFMARIPFVHHSNGNGATLVQVRGRLHLAAVPDFLIGGITHPQYFKSENHFPAAQRVVAVDRHRSGRSEERRL